MQVIKQPDRHVKKDATNKDLEPPWIRQEVDSDNNTDQDPRPCAPYNYPGKGPCHSPLPYVPVNPAWCCKYIKYKICRAHRRTGKTEYTDLKRQQKKCAGQSPHGCKKRDYK